MKEMLYEILVSDTKKSYKANANNYASIIKALDHEMKKNNILPRKRKLNLYVLNGKQKELICSYVWKKNKLVEKY